MTTEIYFNGQLAYFDKEEVITGSYALNKAGDLKSRQGASTNTYTLPFVKQNKAIFSNAELLANEGAGPYTKYTHEVIIEGISVFKGSAFVAESFEGYKVQAVAGNSDFYLLLKNNSIRDLDFTDLDHTRDDATVIASWPNTEGYIYPFVDYGKYQNLPSQSLGSDDSGNFVCPADLYPAVFLKTLIQKISEFTGYVFTGPVFGNARYIDEFIPFANFPFKQDSLEGKLSGIGTYTIPPWPSAVNLIPLLTVLEEDPSDPYDDFGFYNVLHTKYIKISIEVENLNENRVIIAVTKRDAAYASNDPGDLFTVGDTNLWLSDAGTSGQITAFVQPGERIFIKVVHNNTLTATATIRIKSFLIETSEMDNGYGLPWKFSLNLPDIKLDKFLLDFMNRYGLSIDTDNELKIVSFWHDDQILLNEPIDWTGKIDYTDKPEIFYRFEGYKQLNRLTYKVTDELPDGFEYDFPIADQTLPDDINEEFTSEFSLAPLGNSFLGAVQTINSNQFIIKLPFRFRGMYSDAEQYPENDIVFYHNGFFKSIVNMEDNGYLYPLYPPLFDILTVINPEWEGIKQSDVWTIKATPLISRVNRMLSGPTVDFQDSPAQEINVFAINTGMDWPSIWGNHYNALKRMLVKTKIPEYALLLNYSDIAQLDLTRPVWFEELGLTFKVDEVKQFKFNEVDSTIVRLIRL